jgi:hypothetical protein
MPIDDLPFVVANGCVHNDTLWIVDLAVAPPAGEAAQGRLAVFEDGI